MKPPIIAVIWALVLLVGVTACDSNTQQGMVSPTPASPTETATQAPSDVTPDIAPTPTIVWVNITEEQYNQALSKWHSQGIEEYEARVEHTAYSPFMGIWTLHVRVAGSDYEVLDYTREPGLDAPVGDTGSQLAMPKNEAGKNHVKEQLKMITIEGQFEALREDVGGRGVGCYTVEAAFDTKLGHPTTISSSPTSCSEPTSWELKSLKILKQHTPASTTP